MKVIDQRSFVSFIIKILISFLLTIFVCEGILSGNSTPKISTRQN